MQLTRLCRKRARYDSGEDLVDPSEMFGGGGAGFGPGMGGVQINPEMRMSLSYQSFAFRD